MAFISNCLGKIFKFCLKYSFVILIPLIAIIYAPSANFLLDIEPKSLTVSLPETLKYFQQNKIETWKTTFEYVSNTKGLINGPNSLAYDRKTNRLITGSDDGYLYRIDIDNNHKVQKLFKLIDDQLLMQKQKDNSPQYILHPSSLKFNSKGALFVVEPMFGVFKIENIFTNKPKIELIMDIEKTASLGRKSTFLADLIVQEKSTGGHMVYVSDVSSKFSPQHSAALILSSDSNGRILRYDTDTGKIDVLVSDLFFPNGMEMFPDNNGFIFTETVNRTIWKYLFKDQKASIMMTSLPSEPDKIRASPNGRTFWAALLRPRTLNDPSVYDRLMLNLPMFRKFLVRTLDLIGRLLEWSYRITSVDRLKCLSKQFRSMRILEKIDHTFNHGGMLIEFDLNGKILRTIYKTDKNSEYLSWPSEIREIVGSNSNERILYIGSCRSFHPIRKIVLKE